MKPSLKAKGGVALIMTLSWVAWSSVPVHAGTQHADVMNAFDVETPVQPMPVRTSGMVQISYEIHLTNFSSEKLEITDVSLVNAMDGGACSSRWRVMQRFQGDLPSTG
jgi:hypothetical protein